MKKLFITAMLVVSGALFAQDDNAKHEVVDQMVKSTFYHDNGQVQQEGFYKDGKVHGQWVSYDENGNKVAMGQYQNGMKMVRRHAAARFHQQNLCRWQDRRH